MNLKYNLVNPAAVQAALVVLNTAEIRQIFTISPAFGREAARDMQ
jgi:hypothetical protein